MNQSKHDTELTIYRSRQKAIKRKKIKYIQMILSQNKEKKTLNSAAEKMEGGTEREVSVQSFETSGADQSFS